MSDGNDEAQAKAFRKSRFASVIWAAVFLALIAGWLASGDIIIGGQADANPKAASSTIGPEDGIAGNNAAQATAKPFRVQVAKVSAEPRDAVLVLRGRTEVKARVAVRSETAGIVREMPTQKGERVSAGRLLCRLDAATREADILEAEARVDEARAAHEASRKLTKRGFTSDLKTKGDKRSLGTARALLQRAELDMARTKITAPIDGIIEEQTARVGDYLEVGSACATLVQMDPILLVGAVSERNVTALRVGQSVDARLVTGELTRGVLKFISPTSDTATHTFRIEAEVDNKGLKLRDGVTADIKIPLTVRPAHRIRPSTLSLNDEGSIGVKTVTDENRVAFVPIQILSDGRDSIWVDGLPDEATVITIGQEYVRDGQLVEPVHVAPGSEKAAASRTAQATATSNDDKIPLPSKRN